MQQQREEQVYEARDVKEFCRNRGGIRGSKDEQEKAFSCLLVFVVHGRQKCAVVGRNRTVERVSLKIQAR